MGRHDKQGYDNKEKIPQRTENPRKNDSTELEIVLQTTQKSNVSDTETGKLEWIPVSRYTDHRIWLCDFSEEE